MGHVLYGVVMLPKIYKITSLEKKFFYGKLHGLASQDSLSRWKYRLGVSVGLPTHRLLVGVGVCQVGIKAGS